MRHATTIATSAVTAFLTVAALAWLGDTTPPCGQNCTVIHQTPDATAMLKDLENMQ